MDSVVCVFIVQTEELIKALQDLENAASGDATVRQKIASLPQEVQDVSLLEKITGEKVVWVKDEGRETYLQCIKPQDMLMSANTDLPHGVGFSVILGFANITHMLNKEAAGIVRAWIVTLGITAEMLACHSLWYSVQVRSFETTVQIMCAGADWVKALNSWPFPKKKIVIQCCDFCIVHWYTP